MEIGTAPPPDGMSEVDINDLDYADNPIIGTFGKGGASRGDYVWATEMWATVVAPGIKRGMGRDDFAKRDASRSAPAYRRTADVFDLFTGDSEIVASLRSDGSLEVINGRHRIEVARDLGIQSLPVRIIE